MSLRRPGGARTVNGEPTDRSTPRDVVAGHQGTATADAVRSPGRALLRASDQPDRLREAVPGQVAYI